ncbi:hypothetical protein ATI61_106140 [Archangium gephyra]|uniref:Uncharacterized protein n=1 Tax=Archangium gephyra TaxID=48 RepID=A0ABX9JZW3_9BACT|nr:hypothetical protein [Archangium gephyra]REG30671.1 hypothetical protein ATI61_106140 [Archangium gephyra]
MKQAPSRWPVRVVACAVLALSGTASAEGKEEFSRSSERRGENRDDSYQIEQRQRWFIESRGLDRVPNAGAERAQAAQELKEQLRARSMQLGPGEVWQPLGPSSMNMGSWVMGRVSGRTNVIVPHPTDENTVYFGAAAGGVWKTTNAGVSWTSLFDQVGTLPVGSIFVEPSAPTNVWVGTGDKNGGGCAGYFGQGVFLSQDGGSTWTAKNGSGTTVMPLSIVNAVAVQPTNSNVVLAGGSGTCSSTGALSGPGLFRTTDRGATWSRVLSVNAEDIVFVPGSATVYAAAPGSGVYKSTDGGATWTLSISGMTVSGSRMRLAMAPSNSNVLYVLMGGNVYRSLDGAATWALRSSAACEGQCTYNQAISVHPTNTNAILVGTIRPSMSTDGGATYTFLTTGWGSGQKVHQDIHVVLFSKLNGNRFWIGGDGGLWRTDDNGVNFTNMNSNLNVTQFYDIAVHPSNSDIVFGGAQDNSSLSRNGSVVWDLTQVTGDGFMNALDPTNPNIVFQTSYPSGGFPKILRSTTGGGAGTFSYLPDTGLTSSSNFPWVTPLAVASNSIFVASDVVYRGVTSASPFTWTAISGNIGRVSVISPMLQGAMIPTFVGTSAGRVYYSADARIASPTFTDVTGNYPGGTVSDVAMTPGNPQRVFITRSGFGASRLYRSTTGGTTWTAVGSGLPNVPANSVAIDPLNTQRVFVGTDVGVYESTDGGDTFIAFSLGLPLGLVVTDLEVDDVPHFLHAGTYGRGAWKVALAGGSTPVGSTFSYTASNTTSATVNTSNKLIALTAGQVLTLGTCGVTGSTFSGDTYLRLYNPSAAEVISNDDACGGVGSSFTYTVPAGAGGNYELRAGCYSSGSCSGTVAWTVQ